VQIIKSVEDKPCSSNTERLYEANSELLARIHWEGASAPPKPSPRKNKNKTCLSKMGSVRLLTLKIEPCRIRQKASRDEPEGRRRYSGLMQTVSAPCTVNDLPITNPRFGPAVFRIA
jgi:hypothetical protein